MPFIETTTPLVVPGVSGSYARVLENHLNAHTTANPQGLEPVYGSSSPGTKKGDNATGGRNAPNAAESNNRGDGTGNSTSPMNIDALCSHRNPGGPAPATPKTNGCNCNCPPCNNNTPG